MRHNLAFFIPCILQHGNNFYGRHIQPLAIHNEAVAVGTWGERHARVSFPHALVQAAVFGLAVPEGLPRLLRLGDIEEDDGHLSSPR